MSKKDKSLKAIPCEELNEKQIELLYKFLQDKDTIYNKDRSLSSSILWDVIYLRKIFSKSVYSRKSGKYRAKYNYVILEDDKIITFFTLHHISKKTDLNILELQTILDKSLLSHVKKDMMLDINNLMILEFNKISSGFLVNTVLTIYIPVSNDNLNNLANLANQANQEEDNKGLSLIFIDNQTFKETYNIYYKLYTQQNTHPNEEITKGYITNKLLEHYGLNTIINPTRELSGKLTRKSIAIPDIKIITKNIFDIKEIQDRPEYDYDFDKMYLISSIQDLTFLYENINEKDLINLTKKRFFPSNIIIFNDKLFDIYSNLMKNLKKNYNLCIFYKKIIKHFINIITRFNIKFTRYLGDNLKIITDYKKNKLILTSSIDEIILFSKYKYDIINIKNQKQNYEEFVNIKKINPNIVCGFTIDELKNTFKTLNKKYDNIYINNIYMNYDYIVRSIYLFLKLPYFSYILLSSLNLLNNNGNLIFRVYLGNKIEIPFLKKIFSMIIQCFDNYEFSNYFAIQILVIEFKKFNSNAFKKIKLIIDKTLLEIAKYENNEFILDDVVNLLLSNNFYYKIQSNENIFNKNLITKHILYDLNIDEFISINNKSNEFILKYNNLVDKLLLFYKNIYNYLYNDNQYNFCKKINDLFIYKILLILKSYFDNELLDYNTYFNISKIILNSYKNDNSYIAKLILVLKPNEKFTPLQI
jgi:hypothetical protein